MTETDPQAPRRPRVALKFAHKVMNISWWDLLQAAWPLVLLGVAAVYLALRFANPAPPHSLTIGTGPKGSQFETMAGRYRSVLARNGIKLQVVATDGSLDNLKRLSDPKSHIDIALVQSGTPTDDTDDNLVSLGSLFYEPLMVFYRAKQPLQRLSDLHGRVAIGAAGSGVRNLALALLKANGIAPGGTIQLLPLEGDAARQALLNGEADAIFLGGDSASPATLREMLHSRGILMFNFTRADAYVRHFPYLSKLTLPPGTFDLGADLPHTSINLLAPTVELVARPDLHPALIDLLIQAATEINGRSTVLQPSGQFPNAQTAEFPIDSEAARYYKSGDKSLTYRYLPFWLASLVNRILVVVVPALVIVIPSLKFLPQLYNWRITRRIHHIYGSLMALERESLGAPAAERRLELQAALEDIEHSVIALKIPGSHAQLAYHLREHIEIARHNLARAGTPLQATDPTTAPGHA